jgi:hypothetical protein
MIFVLRHLPLPDIHLGLLHQVISQLRPDVGVSAVEEQALCPRGIVCEFAIEAEDVQIAGDVLDQPVGVVFVQHADVAGELQPADEGRDIALAVLVVGGIGNLTEVVQSIFIELGELAVDEELLVSIFCASEGSIVLGCENVMLFFTRGLERSISLP